MTTQTIPEQTQNGKPQTPDPQKLQELAFRMVDELGATATGSLILVGDELGLFKTLAAREPVTSEDLANLTGTRERYVREWLSTMAASFFVEYDAGSRTFFMTPEQAAVFADEDNPMFMIGGYHSAKSLYLDEKKIAKAFRSGDGVAWGDHSDCLFTGSAMFYRPSYNSSLVQSWIPSLDGVEAKLKAGATVADVGCGHGFSTVIMAKAYPNSTFVGIEPHAPSMEVARRHAAEAGVTNVRFEPGSAQDFEGDYDLIAFFDCLHDMGDPVGAARNARARLKDGGAVMVVEPLAGDRLEENLNPVGRVYYAYSTMVCTPASLSQDVGRGLGAQAGEKTLTEVLTEGGFRTVHRAVDTPFNIVLEAR